GGGVGSGQRNRNSGGVNTFGFFCADVITHIPQEGMDMADLGMAPWMPPKCDGTLILGESTFRGSNTCPTRWGIRFDSVWPRGFVIEHVKDNSTNDKDTFNAIRNSFEPVLEPQEFWNTKAFWNYVTRLLDKREDRPSLDDWQQGKEHFTALLALV